MKILRLQDECGRNLADVHRSGYSLADGPGDDYNPAGVFDGLWVTPRPNVHQRTYRPNLSPGITYTWRCRCGRTSEVRHERLSSKWTENAHRRERVIVLVVGRDV